MNIKELQVRFEAYPFRKNTQSSIALKEIGGLFLSRVEENRDENKNVVTADDCLDCMYSLAECEILNHHLQTKDARRLYQCQKISWGGCLLIYHDELRPILYTENQIKQYTSKKDGYCRLDDNDLEDQARILFRACQIIDKILGNR